MEYLLFIDETGSFLNPEEPAGLVGCCIPGPHSVELIQELYLLPKIVHGTVPYPPHASLMHWISSRAGFPKTPFLCTQIEIENHLRDSSQKCFDATGASQWRNNVVDRWSHQGPTYDALTTTDGHMLHSALLRRARNDLLRARNEDYQWRNKVFANLTANGVFPVIAVEPCAGAASGAGHAGSPIWAWNRYQTVLAALLQHFVRLTGNRFGPWWVSHASFFPKGLDHRQALRNLAEATLGPIVRSTPIVQPYDARTHPGIVIADMMAWATGRPLRGCGHSWLEVKNIVSARGVTLERNGCSTVVPVASGEPDGRWAPWAREVF